MQARTMLAAAIAVLGLLLAACGGSDEDAAEASARSYLEALSNGDAAGVCELISSRTLADIGSHETCEGVFATGFELLDEKGSELPDYDVVDVSLEDGSATISVTVAGREQEIQLISEDGEWKLDGATAVSQFHPDLVPGDFP
jgi:hypothetical protein